MWRLLLGYLPADTGRRQGGQGGWGREVARASCHLPPLSAALKCPSNPLKPPPSLHLCRQTALARKRREYGALIPAHHAPAAAAAHAGAAAGDDAAALRQVSVDVPRTAPGVPLFARGDVRAALTRVLYLWGVRGAGGMGGVGAGRAGARDAEVASLQATVGCPSRGAGGADGARAPALVVSYLSSQTHPCARPKPACLLSHPASGYVQGMNDVATPLLGVFVGAEAAAAAEPAVGGGGDPASAPPPADPADPAWADFPLPPSALEAAEADAYWCLGRVLEGMQARAQGGGGGGGVGGWHAGRAGPEPGHFHQRNGPNVGTTGMAPTPCPPCP